MDWRTATTSTPPPSPRPPVSASDSKTGRALAESPGDVVFRETVTRVGEHPVRVAHLDELSEMEVRGALRHARRLLHRVRDDHDRILFAQLIDQILDARGGNGIERGMHRRCCCPPESPVPEPLRRSFTSSQSPARVRLVHTMSSSWARLRARPWMCGP